MTVNLGRIHEDFARITSDSVDPGWGRGSIDSQLGKDLQRVCKDYLTVLILGESNQQSTWEGSMKTLQGLPQTVLILGGGQLTVNLGRIHEDFTRITSDSVYPGVRGFNQQSPWEGSTKTLQGLPQTVLILRGQLTVNLG